MLSPPSSANRPPLPVLPVPILSNIDPDLPFVASPVVKLNVPLSPALDVPVRKVKPPLIPFGPAFGVVKVNDPLDVLSLYPVLISILPPLPLAANPAFTVILPPSSLVSLPFV